MDKDIFLFLHEKINFRNKLVLKIFNKSKSLIFFWNSFQWNVQKICFFLKNSAQTAKVFHSFLNLFGITSTCTMFLYKWHARIKYLSKYYKWQDPLKCFFLYFLNIGIINLCHGIHSKMKRFRIFSINKFSGSRNLKKVWNGWKNLIFILHVCE